MNSLYKTTIVIWSDGDPSNTDIDNLARDAVQGDSYCSSRNTKMIDDPKSDKDWDGTEFFGEEEE